MAEVSAALVKELREKTGVGMMDCKKALAENNGDLEASIDWLRAKGLSKAAKKADRAAAEGLVAIAVAKDGGHARGAIIEFNSETDFVARNEGFQKAALAFAKIALDAHGDLAKTLASRAPDGDGAVQDHITRLIATIGENMTLRRVGYLTAEGAVVSYIHNQTVEGAGRIGVLVALDSAKPGPALDEIGRKIAMHIAATAPAALTEAEVPADRIEREKAIILEQVKEDPKLAGKPQNVLDGAVNGKLRKILEDIVLLKQKFVHNPDLTVEAAVKAAEKDVGAPITLKAFLRYQLGDGVEKPKDDFAAEVAAMTKS
jgi:elongation factor Ts